MKKTHMMWHLLHSDCKLIFGCRHLNFQSTSPPASVQNILLNEKCHPLVPKIRINVENDLVQNVENSNKHTNGIHVLTAKQTSKFST